MGDDGKSVDRRELVVVASRNTRAIRQAKAAAQRLLGQDLGGEARKGTIV